MKNRLENRFMSWRDLVITPLVSIVILTGGVGVARLSGPFLAWDGFWLFLVFFFAQTTLTLAALALMRMLWPMREGVFDYAQNPREVYVWNLYNYLCIVHLNLFYDKILLPIPFRKPFFQLMGARIGGGIVPVSGQLLDPHLIELDENTHVGEDALLTAHAITSDNKLYLARIRVGAGAMIGAKSTLMPGVTVGEGAMVNAMSLVTTGTTIPPFEVWGGVPARKLRSLIPEGKAE